MISYLKRILPVFDEQAFDLSLINANMFFLNGLESNAIACLKNGRLIKKERRGRFATKRLEETLKALFFCFLYEIRSPLDPEGMQRYFLHKKRIADKALANLKRYTTVRTDQLQALVTQFEKNYLQRKDIVIGALKAPSRSSFVANLQQALTEGVMPLPVLKGFSGTWIMRDVAYRKVAIFKPFDEEMGAPHNPAGDHLRGVLGSFMIRSGIPSGESYLREVAVYQISHYLGFSVVPETLVASFQSAYFYGVRRHFLRDAGPPKIGSLQLYIDRAQGFGSLNKKFLDKLAHGLLHPIFLLDMIVGHDDRHGQNILWDGYKAWAIDNGLALSATPISGKGWHWLAMPQAKIPLHPLLKIKMISLKAEDLMKYVSFDPRAAERLKERLAVLKAGLEKNLPLFVIAEAMSLPHMKSLMGLDQTLAEKAREIMEERLYQREREDFWPLLL